MTDAIPLEDRTIAGAPTLSWVAELFWPESSLAHVTLVRTGKRPGVGAAGWSPLPSADEPTILVPLSRRAGAASMRQYNQSMSQTARLRKAIAGAAIRAGAISMITKEQLHVSLSDVPIDWRGLIESVLPDLVGVRRVEVAISVGRALRPNVKPVIQVMDRRGKPLAYAKIGWNDLTKDLVRNEARALRAWEASPPRSFGVPRLIRETGWNGLTVALLSPIPHRLMRRGRMNASPPARVLAEVIELGDSERAPLGRSAYWSGVMSRIEALDGSEVASGLRSALSRVGSDAGDVELRFGSCHGDWTPWNMGRADGRLFVWDWERYADPVPVGFDALHFEFEVAFHKQRADVAAAAERALACAARSLDLLDVPANARRLLARLYAVERILRLEEGRSVGVPVHEGMLFGLQRMLTGEAS
jgi:hypothetical protein